MIVKKMASTQFICEEDNCCQVAGYLLTFKKNERKQFSYQMMVCPEHFRRYDTSTAEINGSGGDLYRCKTCGTIIPKPDKKVCAACGKEKFVTEFYTNRKTLRKVCKVCFVQKYYKK